MKWHRFVWWTKPSEFDEVKKVIYQAKKLVVDMSIESFVRRLGVLYFPQVEAQYSWLIPRN